MHKLQNALIVLNYNDSETTSNFVRMAQRGDAIDKIIVVDNCSADDSYEVLRQLVGDRVDVIKSEKNGGYAYGNNYGCRYAIDNYNPDVLFISNPDVEFEQNVVISMQEALINNENLGVIAPIVNQGYNVWNLPKFWGVIESIFLVWFNLDKKNIKNRLINSSSDVETVGVVEGSFWAVKKDAFLKTGGLDDRTFLYYEENIFANRLKKNGYYIAVLTGARYNHFHSISIKKRYGNKSNAFKNFYLSMKLYLNEYLNANNWQILIFEVAFVLGYLERYIFDLIQFIKMKVGYDK